MTSISMCTLSYSQAPMHCLLGGRRRTILSYDKGQLDDCGTL